MILPLKVILDCFTRTNTFGKGIFIDMIAIIDYKMGNLASVKKSLAYIGLDAVITSNPLDLARADAIILPGVGAMSTAMDNLQKSQMIPAIYESVKKGKPFLGICLGMQMLFEGSEEGAGSACGSKGFNPNILGIDTVNLDIKTTTNSNLVDAITLQSEGYSNPACFENAKIIKQSSLVKGLGILKGAVRLLPKYPSIKIPHMGWNQLSDIKGPLFEEGKDVYFVHSYVVVPDDESIITAYCVHGDKFVAAVQMDNVCGMQFHPEKSGDVGLEILKRWAVLKH